MRKFLLIALLAALCCNGVLAQDDDNYDRPNRIAIGPKAGVGLAMGSHSAAQNLDFKMGLAYQAGAAFNAHFGRRYSSSDGGTGWFAIEIEAMYSGRGIKLGSDKINMSCIEVPVLAQLYVIPTFAVEAGATMVKVLRTSPAQIISDGVTYNVGDIKGSDVMATLGLCYKTPTGIMVDARYNLGLSPLAGNFDTKVSTFMVSFAYLFNIVK